MLNLGGVLEHDASQVTGGEGAVNISLKPLAAEIGQVATMVDVSVAENDCVDRLWVEGKSPVALNGFPAFSLIQTTFQEKPLAVQLQ